MWNRMTPFQWTISFLAAVAVCLLTWAYFTGNNLGFNRRPISVSGPADSVPKVVREVNQTLEAPQKLPPIQLPEVSAQQSPAIPAGEKTMTIDKLIVREVVVDKQTVENSHVKKKEVDYSHTKKKEVDQEQVKCQKVDNSQVDYQHVNEQDVDYSHVKRQDVDDQYVNRQKRRTGGGAVARVATKAPCPSGVCSEYAWNPADPRQPAPGTVSPRQF